MEELLSGQATSPAPIELQPDKHTQQETNDNGIRQWHGKGHLAVSLIGEEELRFGHGYSAAHEENSHQRYRLFHCGAAADARGAGARSRVRD